MKKKPDFYDYIAWVGVGLCTLMGGCIIAITLYLMTYMNITASAGIYNNQYIGNYDTVHAFMPLDTVIVQIDMPYYNK